MFCKNCGRQIPDDAAFCPACGSKRSGGNNNTYDEQSRRDIRSLPDYAKEKDLNRSGYAVDSDRSKFSLSGNSGQKKFSLSDPGQKKFSLSDSGQKKFSLSQQNKDPGNGIVRTSVNTPPAPPAPSPKPPTPSLIKPSAPSPKPSAPSLIKPSAPSPEPSALSPKPVGFVNPLKDSGKTIFHDEPAANEATANPEQPAAPGQDGRIAPERSAGPAAQSAVNDFYNGTAGGSPNGASGGETGFVNPLKESGQEIHWGSDGDRNEAKKAEAAGDPAVIDSHLGFAIFSTICCCPPTGIVAIIFASMVSQQIQAGNYEQAQKYSNLAKTFCWISIFLGLFCCGGSSILSSFEEAASAAAGAAAP